MERICRAAENLISFEAIGLPKEFDERLEQYFAGCYCIEPYDFIQYALWQIRANNHLSDYDPFNHHDKNFKVFSSEEWKTITQALIANGFVEPDSSLNKVAETLRTSIVGGISEDILQRPGSFFNWCYEYLGYAEEVHFNDELLETALKVVYSPKQYEVLEWMIKNHYYYCEENDTICYRVPITGKEETIQSSEYQKVLVAAVYEVTEKWIKDGNFYIILEAALSF